MNITSIDDVFALSDEEAQELFDALYRRQVMQDAQSRVEGVMQEYLDARDGHEPDPATATVEDYPTYVAPTGAHDAYLKGRIICWDEKLYRAVRTGVAHNPTEAPEEWQEVFLVDGEITTERPVNPDTGEPDWPAWDSATSYRQNPDNTPLVIVSHKDKLWELIHANANPGEEPGDPAMWAVWREYEGS